MENFTGYSDVELTEFMKGPKTTSDLAFTEIYRRYSKKIFSYCLLLLRDRDWAKDIFQETFTKFYQSPSLKNPNLGGYLYTIARNLCYNEIKRKNVEINQEITIDEVFDAVKNYEKNELFQLILTSLDLLDEKYREVFILREFEGLHFREIAEVCSLSLVNAKSRYLRAKEKIIKVLEPYLKDLCR